MKHYKNGLIYFLTMIITVVVYLVIHLYCSGVKSELLKEQEGYANNNINQPVNNIISIAKEDKPIKPNDDKKTPTPTPTPLVITSIRFAQENISIKKGDTLRLIVEVIPSELISSKFTWKSSDPSIVSIDEFGNITGLKEGTVTITVTSPNGKTATIKVTVVPDEIKANTIIVNPNKLTLDVGSSSQISAKVEPTAATNRELIWESNNPYVATVDENGVVKGISPGTVKIIVKTKDGTVTSEIIVTILPVATPTPTPIPTITPTPSPQDIYFEYDYDNDNYIYLINQFPIRDEVGKNLQGDKRTHDFKIKVNAKAEGVHYTIVAEKMDGNTLDDKWTKMYLVKDGSDVANCYRASNRIKTFNEYAKYQSNPKEAVIYEGIVSKSEALRGYIDYTFRMWVSEDLELQNSDYLSQSRTYRARINVYASKND